MDNILNRLKKGENLSFEETKKTFENMMSGNLNDEEISNFLTLLSDKGETSDERLKRRYKCLVACKRLFSANFLCEILWCIENDGVV